MFFISYRYIKTYEKSTSISKNPTRFFEMPFHKNANEHYISYFPMLTNYENFLKAANKAAGAIGAFVQYQLYLNSLHCLCRFDAYFSL